MMEICKRDDCTACEACVAICAANAIRMMPDEKGFLRPAVNAELCLDCGACREICPANGTARLRANQIEKKVFAAWTKNAEIRAGSSSGGLFSEIAGWVLNQNGVVFGARWTDDLTVALDYCENVEGLEALRWSKYVQARTNDAYPKAKQFLDDGRKVLFAGTPCQIAGLLSYLGREYANLITVDLVCHGVPSPMVFKDYIAFLEKQYKERVRGVIFRYKKPAWSSCSVRVAFDHATYINSVYCDPYFIGFNYCFYLRECCHCCKYANLNRLGDITLADFWGYQPKNWKMRDFDKGCSSVIVNTERGMRIFEAISGGLIFENKNLADSIGGNRSLTQPYVKAEKSDAFWTEYLATRDFEAASRKFFIPAKPGLRALINRYKNRYRILIPKPLLRFIRIFRHS